MIQNWNNNYYTSGGKQIKICQSHEEFYAVGDAINFYNSKDFESTAKKVFTTKKDFLTNQTKYAVYIIIEEEVPENVHLNLDKF